MTQQQDLLVSWLNDAYAMEDTQIQMLERVINDFDDSDEVRRELTAHLEDTKQQKERIQECLESLDEKPSKMKSLFSKVMGNMQGMSTSGAQDTQMKDMLMLHAGEHFEHASYEALAAAADKLGYEDIAQTCRDIAKQEQATADWAEGQIGKITDKTLRMAAA